MSNYIRHVQQSINSALAASYRRNAYDERAVYVAHITLVKGVPYFGYHVGYRYFLKVYLLNPLHMTRLADLLLQGQIIPEHYQPYESHMQYLSQWMCDNNLYGCAYVNCSKVRFRSPVPSHEGISNTKHQWHDGSIPADWFSDADLFPRHSYCSLEVDICVQDIMNRKEIHERPTHQDFGERLIRFNPDEKLVHSMAGLWRDETARRKRRMGITDSFGSPFPPEALVTMSADPRHDDLGGWVHEEEYKSLIKQIIQEEKARDFDTELSFENFVKPLKDEEQVKTAFQSIEDLYPKNIPTSLRMQSSQVNRGHQMNGDERIPVASQVVNGNAFYDDIDEALLGDANVEALQNETLELFNSLADSSKQDILRRRSYDEFLAGIYEAAAIENGTGQFDSEDGSVTLTPRRASVYSAGSTPFRSRKRRKLDTDFPVPRSPLSDNSPSRPASRHVKFDSKTIPDRYDKNGRESQALIDFQLPHFSQSSQGSIKSNGSQRSSNRTFSVVKTPFTPDRKSSLSQLNKSSEAKLLFRSSGQSKTSSSPSKTNTSKTSSQRKSISDASDTTVVPSSQEAIIIAKCIANTFDWDEKRRICCYKKIPPTSLEVASSMFDVDRPPVIYQKAYYSNEKDVPERPREYAGREFRLESNTVPYLPDFDPTGSSLASLGEKPAVVVDRAAEARTFEQKRQNCTLRSWEIAALPPLRQEVEAWLEQEAAEMNTSRASTSKPNRKERLKRQAVHNEDLSQIDGPTQRNTYGFKYSQRQQSTSVQHETQYMSIMSLEVHVNTRGSLVPDPNEDEVSCIFWCTERDDDDVKVNSNRHSDDLQIGVLALADQNSIADSIFHDVDGLVEEEETELDLINRMVDIVRQFDPDILTGYEVHNGSWGYLIERARVKYDYNLCDEFSRMKSLSHGRFGKEADRWGFEQTSTIRITGRHVINIWRAMRGELNLLQYTVENVAFHLLHKRVPHYSYQDLTQWYSNDKLRDTIKVIKYYVSRATINLQILDANEFIPRTSEQARLLGVDFFSVISRGSQYKVESLMFRIAKPENFILPSPSRKQVGQQNALECLPLVMEPQSDFYTSPLLVLDFQSLYPSVMIAYNYCYSTCLGRIIDWRGQSKLGFTTLKRQTRLVELLQEYINIAPNGIMYVKPEIRKSLLAKMLSEILETRIMVKSGMKVDKEDKTLQRLLNNRQLALKLISNVTYGYTSASFSGRMPCSEIADSIVQTARETLEKTIALIHSVDKWGAEVVYGDTDSIFVYLKGRSRDEAFNIGNEIAKTVTDAHPRPMKLKFEKVYHPCVLLAKKRYVGFKYEHRHQAEPDFDAKGIETVRRDGTPAEQKIEEKALRILFNTADLSQVKGYFQRQCAKIMAGRISIQDFCFAKEVRLGTYSDKGPGPPGALVAAKRILADPRAEPQYGERVPYVVIAGAPGARLIDRCVAPEKLLLDESAELDAEYYISKNLIPPLERIFNLVGANVRQWYDEMPRTQRIRSRVAGSRAAAAAGGAAYYAENNSRMGVAAPVKRTLEAHFSSSLCIVCRAKLPPPKSYPDQSTARLPLCVACAGQPFVSLYTLKTRVRRGEVRLKDINAVCRSCAGLAFGEDVRCDSRDCPVFYTRVRERTALQSLVGSLGDVISALEGLDINDRENVEW